MRGFKEEGTTTTPFDMVVLNELDRFHLAIDVIDRVPRLRDVGAHVKQQFRDKLIEHKRYIAQHGEDMPEIRDWKWAAEPARQPSQPLEIADKDRDAGQRDAAADGRGAARRMPRRACRDRGRSPIPRRAAARWPGQSRLHSPVSESRSPAFGAMRVAMEDREKSDQRPSRRRRHAIPECRPHNPRTTTESPIPISTSGSPTPAIPEAPPTIIVVMNDRAAPAPAPVRQAGRRTGRPRSSPGLIDAADRMRETVPKPPATRCRMGLGGSCRAAERNRRGEPKAVVTWLSSVRRCMDLACSRGPRARGDVRLGWRGKFRCGQRPSRRQAAISSPIASSSAGDTRQ